QDKGLTVIGLEERQKKFGDIRLSFLEKIKIKDLVLFYRQLSMMISSDIPVVKALQIISSQAQNPKMQGVLIEIYENVNEGMKFSDALAKYKKIFGDFYINMIRSGEISGKFDEVLLYLADSQEKDYQFRAKLKGAMTYPMFILSAMFLMGLGMMIFVIPRLTAMLLETGVKLPITTRMLIAASDFTKSFWYLIILGVIGSIFGFKAFINKTLLGKKIWHKALLKIPKLGPDLVQKTYLVHLTKSLAMLLVGGVPLTQAIEITSAVVGNYYYEKMLKYTADSVKDGNTIASVFMQYPNLIPNMLTQMTSVGEQTGRVDQVFEKIGKFYEAEVDNMVENISKIIEPVIMLLMGGAVGFLVISIMLPMFKASEAVG
ncbi:MAG: type II secretion system F family protein, partial [Candidatus Jacksonbacteria bacterium]